MTRAGTMRWPALALAAVALIGAPAGARAHLGSPDVFLEDRLGGENVVLGVRMPSAVPGEALVELRFPDLAAGAQASVQVQEIPPLGGPEAAPPWRVAERSEDDPNFFSAPVPLTLFGTWRVRIAVTTANGSETLEVPVPAPIPGPRRMPGPFVAAFSLLLVASLASLTLVLGVMGAEGHLAPGEAPGPDDARRRRKWMVGTFGLQVLFFGLVFTWWGKLAEGYARLSIDPVRVAIQPAVAPVAGRPIPVRLALSDTRGGVMDDLRLDHGRLMHLAVVKLPGASVFFHLHPDRVAPGTLEITFVPPEPGRYAFFGDIVDGAGVGHTVTGDLDVAPGAGAAAPLALGSDDVMVTRPALDPARTNAVASDLGDGLRMTWQRAEGTPLEEDDFQRHLFVVTDSAGQPATLEPYMGMAGHLLVMRSDGEIFSHVHPTGTLPGLMPIVSDSDCAFVAPGAVTFPYAFPEEGTYRLWAQVRTAGAVRTGVFDVTVR